jgi:integrase
MDRPVSRPRPARVPETTREDYRRDLERYAFKFFKDEPLTTITPRRVAQYAAWLCRQPAPGGGQLADATVRRILSPLRACMGTAVREGLIRANPTTGLALPHRPRIEAEDDDVKALTVEQHRRSCSSSRRAIAPCSSCSQPRACGSARPLRCSGSTWRWTEITRTSRFAVRLSGARTPPKSRYGRRNVPVPFELVRALRTARAASEWPGDDDLLFPASNGQPLQQPNLRRRVLKPAADEAGVGWMGFHTLRHTCASMLFERGANAVQVQRWLGHHSPTWSSGLVG